MSFDGLSFCIGIILTNLFYFGLFLNRKRLGEAREWGTAQFANIRENLTASSDNRYRRDLITNLQQHHTAASILALDDLLVPPTFLPEPPSVITTDEADLNPRLAVPFTPESPLLAGVYQVGLRTLKDVARATVDLVIVGDPGSGKSTTLQSLAIEAARRNTDLFPDARFPIYLHLGNIAIPPQPSGDLLPQLLEASNRYVSALSANAIANFMRNQLRAGRALLLIDGLDELPANQQLTAIQWIIALRKQFPNNRCFVAANFRGYQVLLNAGFATVYLADWSQDAVQDYVNKWVAAWPAVLKAQKRKASAEDLDPALVAGWLTGGALGRTPFALTLKIWSALAGDAEGPRQVDWIRTYIKRLQVIGEMPSALEDIALTTLRESLYTIPADTLRAAIVNVSNVLPEKERSSADPLDVIDDIAGRAGGLLKRRANNQIAFAHPLVRAYLAAHALSHEGSLGANVLVQESDNPAWFPVMTFFASLSDPTAVAAGLLKQPLDVLYTGLFLMAAWLPDGNAQHRWHSEAMRRLAQVLLTTQAPIELRGRALAALVAANDENVPKLLAQSLAAQDPIARQLACLGLGALNDFKNTDRLKAVLQDPVREVRFAAALALALISSDDALEALTDLLVEGELDQPTMAAIALTLNPVEGHATLRDAISFDNHRTRRAALVAIRRLPNLSEMTDMLTERIAAEGDWMAKAAAEGTLEIAKTPPIAAFTVPAPPDQTGWLSKWYATQGRSIPIGDEAYLVIHEALSADDPAVQIAAADYVARRSDTAAIPILQQVNRQTNQPAVRRATFRALTDLARARTDTVPF